MLPFLNRRGRSGTCPHSVSVAMPRHPHRQPQNDILRRYAKHTLYVLRLRQLALPHMRIPALALNKSINSSRPFQILLLTCLRPLGLPLGPRLENMLLIFTAPSFPQFSSSSRDTSLRTLILESCNFIVSVCLIPSSWFGFAISTTKHPKYRKVSRIYI